MSKRTKLIFIVGLLVAAAAITIFVIRGWSANPRAIEAEADSSFQAENYEDARIKYLNLLRIEPENAHARQRIGEVYLKQGHLLYQAEDYDEARIKYMYHIQVEPENAHAHQRIGQVFLKQGLLLQAASWLGRSLVLSPDVAEAQEDLLQTLIGLNYGPPARKLALEILGANPTHDAAMLAAATGSRSEEDLKDVEKRLEKFDPSKHATYHLVQVLLQTRRGAEVAGLSKSLDRALELEPESVAVHRARANYFGAAKDKAKFKESLELAAELSPTRSKERISYATFLKRNGEPDAAREFLTKMTEDAPDYVPAWLLMAELAMEGRDKKKPDEREADEKKALAILNQQVFGRDATNYEGQVLKAQILLNQKKVDEATKLFEELDVTYSKGAPAISLRIKEALARIYFARGDLSKSASALDQALSLAPTLPTANLLRAQVYLRLREPSAAAKLLEPLLKANPKLIQAELLLAQAYRALGRLDAAAKIYRSQIARDSEKAGPHLMLGLIQAAEKRYPEAKASLEKAQELAPTDQTITVRLMDLDFRDKDFESAHRRAKAHVDRNKDDWGGYFLEGRVYANEKKWKETEENLLKALELNPNSQSVYDLLIKSYIASDQQAKGIARLRELLKKNPKRLQDRMLLAMLLNRDGKKKEAAEEYATLLIHHPDYVPALNNLAYLSGELLGDYDRALELAQKAQELAPDNPGVSDTLGWILYNKKEYSKALPLLEQAHAKASDRAEILYHLGMARLMMGQDAAGKQALEEVVASEDDFADKELARKRLAQLTSGTAEESIEDLEARITATPGNLSLRMKLGGLYAEKGEFKKAASSFQAALKINADLVEALVGLSHLYAEPLKDLKKAKEFADRARSLAPQDPKPAAARGLVALKEGDYSYAYSLLQNAMRGGQALVDPAAKFTLAEASYGLGKVEEARKVMQELTDPESKAPEQIQQDAQRFLTLTDKTPENRPEVTAAVETRLKQDPRDLPALMAQALDQERDGKTSEARSAYEGLIKRAPSFVPSQIRLAVLYSRDPSRRAEAQKLAQKVQSILPKDPEILRTLGILAYHKGDNKYAVQLLKPLDEKKALTAEGLFYLGMTHLKQEENTKATGALEEALKAGLPDELAKLAKEALASQEESSSDEPGC